MTRSSTLRRTQRNPRSPSSFAGLLSRASSFNNLNFLHKNSANGNGDPNGNGESGVLPLEELRGNARSSSNLSSMLKMKRVNKGSRKSKKRNRERTAARKERKATQTLAIVLGE